ncbi:7-epi-alpha-eudesmol synthase [Streptomyces glaucescens]|uniref:Terpene synthase n=1 Tax=Streptomyces glaucescens TaxID=1907 RepID=A0A089XL65_STRGA|nr:7-epi-alpha-eudesmol synthase [Streptomyces glaucescens]AIS01920.1 Terpene synthase metal-binding domain-containing protein [Streptomyces glaucescens]
MPQDVRFDLPFDTPVSPHLEYARERHLRWVREMGLVRSRAGFEEYRSWDLAQAAARTYPYASAEDLVVLMNWFSLAFLFDDQFDAGRLDRADRVAEVARELIVTPLRPAGSRPRVVCPITVAWAQVWESLSDGMSLTWQSRFAASWGRFLVAHCEEVDLAAQGRAGSLDLPAYAAFRRRTVGIHHSIDAGERSRRFEVPPQAMAHPLMERMRDLAADTIGFMNDIHSFERERRRGDGHNLIAVLHRERGCSWETAAAEAYRLTGECLAEYLELEARVPRMCDELGLDAQERARVRMGVEAIQHWINGNYEWALTTGRYAAAKEGPVATAELAGRGSVDDLLTV